MDCFPSDVDEGQDVNDLLPYSTPHSMSDDELRLVATTALKIILNIGSNETTPPLTSMELLTKIMSTKLPSGLFPNKPTPRFRLTDVHRLESILEGLSQPQAWDEGYISVSRDNDTGELTIWEVGLGPRKINTGIKRKRVIDEEADSAAGSGGEDEDECSNVAGSGWAKSTLGGLSKEMRDVYSLLQRGTAKGKLLAEQVWFIYSRQRPQAYLNLLNIVSILQRRV
jgi:mRNA (2'-O-methyladenosine-N6-)-methyltransferase